MEFGCFILIDRIEYGSFMNCFILLAMFCEKSDRFWLVHFN